MIDSINTKTNAYLIQALQALAPVKPVYFRDGNSRSSDLPITSEMNNLFALAIEMSFAQMGVFDTPAMSSGDIFSSEPGRQVLIEPFMGSLLDALQSQNVLLYPSWMDSSFNDARQPHQRTYPQLSWVDPAINIANFGMFGIAGHQDYNHYYPSWIDNSLNKTPQPLQRTYPQLSWVDPAINISNFGMFEIAGHQDYNYYFPSWIDNSLNDARQPRQSTYPQLSWVDSALNIANSGMSGNKGLEMDLQSLIQKVASDDSTLSANESNPSAPSPLLLNFQKLIKFAGQSISALGNIAELGHFLKTLSKNIQGVNPTGNFINIIG